MLESVPTSMLYREDEHNDDGKEVVVVGSNYRFVFVPSSPIGQSHPMTCHCLILWSTVRESTAPERP
jgi:hypothetical protein